MDEVEIASDFVLEEGVDLSVFKDNDGPSIEEDDGKMYCLCGAPSTEMMIACDDSKCPVEWYHYTCVGLSESTIPSGKWYCDHCQPQSKSKPAKKGEI